MPPAAHGSSHAQSVTSDFLSPGELPPGTHLHLILLNYVLPPQTAYLWQRATTRICADGGANRLYDQLPSMLPGQDPAAARAAHLPDLIKGDLDSVRPDVQEFYTSRGVPMIDLSSDQQTTDLEKCLLFLEGRLRAMSEAAAASQRHHSSGSALHATAVVAMAAAAAAPGAHSGAGMGHGAKAIGAVNAQRAAGRGLRGPSSSNLGPSSSSNGSNGGSSMTLHVECSSSGGPVASSGSMAGPLTPSPNGDPGQLPPQPPPRQQQQQQQQQQQSQQGVTPVTQPHHRHHHRHHGSHGEQQQPRRPIVGELLFLEEDTEQQVAQEPAPLAEPQQQQQQAAAEAGSAAAVAPASAGEASESGSTGWLARLAGAARGGSGGSSHAAHAGANGGGRPGSSSGGRSSGGVHEVLASVLASHDAPHDSRAAKRVQQEHIILVLGALGGRLDHTLSNLNTLYCYRHLDLALWGDGNLVRLLRAGRCVIKPSRLEGPTCGLVPLARPATASSSGLKWDLDNTHMCFRGLLSTSNIIGSDTIEVTSDEDLLWITAIGDSLPAPRHEA